MSERNFTVTGEPRGKGRPRFSSRGKYVVAYTDSETAAYENLVALSYAEAYPRAEPMEGPISVLIEAYFPLKKSDYWPVNKRHHGELRKSGWDKIDGRVRPTGKPDADNVGKAALDGLNHANAWRDDSQVVSLRVEKYYSAEPRLEVTLKDGD